MSLKQVIETKLAPAAIGPYSQATAAGNLFFTSGQLGFEIDTMELPDDFHKQVKNALYNLKALVEASGSRMDHVLKVTVYIKDMNRFQDFNEIYRDFFFAQPPAREVVEVSRLPKDALVELSCIGFLKDSLS